MRIAFSLVAFATSLLPGVMGSSPSGSGEASPGGPPGPAGPPGPPGPTPSTPQCDECVGAQGIICAAPGICVCATAAVLGGVQTCSYDSCCAPVAECCDDFESTAYTCIRGRTPTCHRYKDRYDSDCDGGHGNHDRRLNGDAHDGGHDHGHGGHNCHEHVHRDQDHILSLPDTGFTFSNLDSCCSSGTYNDAGRRNLMLHEIADLVATEQELLDHKITDQCKDKAFDTYLFVDSIHFAAIASPSIEAKEAGCPVILANAHFGPGLEAEKQALAWFNTELGEALFSEEKKLFIGNYEGGKLLDAFQAASPAKPGPYDFLTNNCAEFLISLAQHLGVEIDTKIVSFATRRLLEEKRDDLMHRIKDSVSFSSFFGQRHLREENADEHLVQLLVEKEVGLA